MRPSRLIIGEVRSAECLDLLLALNAGLPGMVSIHANSARQALVKMCTLPLLAGENIGAGFVVPTVASSVDLVVHTAFDGDGARRVREVVAVTGRVENGIIESEPVFTRRDGELVRGSGMPARREAFETAGIDLDDVLAASRVGSMGALIGLLAGLGLVLVVWTFGDPGWQPRPRERGDGLARAAGSRRARRRLRRAVSPAVHRRVRAGHVRHVGHLRRPCHRAGVRSCLPRCCPIGVLRGRALRRLREHAELWPDAVDNLASAVRAGLSLPESLVQLGERGPEGLRAPFVRFDRDYQATGRFDESLDLLKARLADPVGDRVIEALRIARDVGGGDLGRMLRALSGFLRDDLRTRGELESRQSWTVNGARLAVVAPWAVLLAMSFQRDVVARYASPTGARGARRRRDLLRRGVPADALDRAASHRATGAGMSRRARRWRSLGTGVVLVALGLASGPSTRPRPPSAAVRPRRPPVRRGQCRVRACSVPSSGPSVRAAADSIGGILGGSASVQRRLVRLGSRIDARTVPGAAGALGHGRIRRLGRSRVLRVVDPRRQCPGAAHPVRGGLPGRRPRLRQPTVRPGSRA